MDGRAVKNILDWIMDWAPIQKRIRGRPRTTWLQGVSGDERQGATEGDWHEVR